MLCGGSELFGSEVVTRGKTGVAVMRLLRWIIGGKDKLRNRYVREKVGVVHAKEKMI